ncbi:sulfotransferase family protein [Sphingobium sp. PAMC28499]|jgi:tetratricopeptide (TPR) repeat protein|uniref:tetratricopeptide repeat-containing sulfotransferase family protein n=1 Tax=Sphingobium TaxID=165695 RepID=UPI0007C633F8|nr:MULTISPECIES: sulfotransferase [Sphingobium]PZU69246.1 MAG: sulfotransferase family protein [Sphingobium sp.]QCB37029.1 sulfotransferase family protein [Sphingobium sp. PAMC28499]RSU73853.1 sulfotransferase family protein [Sphingomonas sp. S-NIH.Pt3_0716]
MTVGFQNSASPTAPLQRNAMQLMMAGQIRPAIQAFRDLIAARPAPMADDWYNLAYLLRCDRQFEAALKHYDQALALGIPQPEDVYLNQAAILSEHLHRQDAAVDALASALKCNSHFVPAWFNLATIHEDRGQAQEARAAYRHILDLYPVNGRAHARLTAIDLYHDQAVDALNRLTHVMAQSGLHAEDRAELHFASGLALDASQQFDEAFAHFQQGNQLARQLIDPALAYDRAAMDRMVDALIAHVPEHSGARQMEDVEDRNAPIFICGLFRSGSTLAERLIGRHSRVTAGGEHESIPAIAGGLPSPATLSSSQIVQLRNQYLNEIGAAFPDASLITDKRPDNFLHIGLIKQLFPDAKIIHTRRNLLDNILSIYFLYFADGISYGFDLDDIVHYVRCYDRLMQHWRSLYGEDIIDLDYDALVQDPEMVMRAVLSALDLPWEEDCARTSNDNAAVKTASSWHVRKPLNDRSSGRWRNYARQMDDVRRALGDAIEA